MKFRQSLILTLCQIDESKSGHVIFGDASKILVKGKGKILICLKNVRINLS